LALNVFLFPTQVVWSLQHDSNSRTVKIRYTLGLRSLSMTAAYTGNLSHAAKILIRSHHLVNHNLVAGAHLELADEEVEPV
jgi:hypothetical protein